MDQIFSLGKKCITYLFNILILKQKFIYFSIELFFNGLSTFSIHGLKMRGEKKRMTDFFSSLPRLHIHEN